MQIVTSPDELKVDRARTPRGAAYHAVGEGEPLVLIHGVGMRLEAWAPQIAAFSESHWVVAVDMPGHGGSAPLKTGADLTDFVAWFADVLDDLGLDRVNVAGHSMGALIAGGAAATLGERIARVALLNGVYLRGEEAAAAVRQRAALIEAGAAIDLDGPLRRWFGEGSEHRDYYRQTRHWLEGVDPNGYATAYSAFANGDATFAGAWPGIRCPALFLTGRDDQNSTPLMAEAMAEAAPRGRAVVIEGRHMVNLTAPGRVNAIMREWLEEGTEQ
ncbi:alpha/beta fold hydrolase [Fulvimarina endophytica]|uniref:Alpha/beta fold hydrolase n=1 Tax=Fulvimarina endophytica TaxID=2293836 RepID=A0A371WZ09_9HYPH|nr:alpha/beta fold hydrolase [Fulvimarina endophytica]RFC62212.1 alpha/beta fold hydrolase [Fulvimarina endophytica]